MKKNILQSKKEERGFNSLKDRWLFVLCIIGAWVSAVLAIVAVVVNRNNTDATVSLAASATQNGDAALMGQIASVISGNGQYIHVSTTILYATILLCGLIAYALSMKAVAIYNHVPLRSLYHKGYWRYFYRFH
ncbi:hypothetical protein AB6D11_02990 [Vibrio splendidus]